MTSSDPMSDDRLKEIGSLWENHPAVDELLAEVRRLQEEMRDRSTDYCDSMCQMRADVLSMRAERDRERQRAESAEASLRQADESADRAWIDGARAGWNYAQVDNHKGLTQCIEDRQKGIVESRKTAMKEAADV